MKTRVADKIQTKLVTLLFGATFSGKTTLGLQLADFKREDGKPFRLLAIDAEGGGMDDAVEDLQDRGIDTRNVQIFYTQSLKELTAVLDKIKHHEVFYAYDEDGNETDEPLLDADGENFFPDAILIDGTTIFRLTSEMGLLELSKKRNTIKADKDGLIGTERFVKIQGADLEFKDYKKLAQAGQNLVLDLMALGINVVLTAREKDITVQKMDKNGQIVSVSTGEKTFDSFKGIDYNVKTILHMYQDSESGQICAKVIKDRTKVHKAGEILEDPTLTDWQTVIDKNANKKKFILQNDLNKAVEIELELYEKEAMELNNAITSTSETSDNSAELDSLRAQIISTRNALTPVKKSEAKKTLEENGLPLKYKEVTDAAVLNEVLTLLKNM